MEISEIFLFRVLCFVFRVLCFVLCFVFCVVFCFVFCCFVFCCFVFCFVYLEGVLFAGSKKLKINRFVTKICIINSYRIMNRDINSTYVLYCTNFVSQMFFVYFDDTCFFFLLFVAPFCLSQMLIVVDW